jgi:hypothetical protein
LICSDILLLLFEFAPYLLCELAGRMVRTDAVNQDDIADQVIGAQVQDLLM